MQITTEGEWHIFREDTRKSFERFIGDASRALLGGMGLRGIEEGRWRAGSD